MSAVADTAFLVAAFRAQESARRDALFADPLAARLAGERGRGMVEKVAHLGDMAGWTTVVRTVLIDRFLTDELERGVKAILNLGAGLDTRPYRMALPLSLSWIEADQAAVIAHKDALLASESPHCRLQRVAVDLADPPARRELLARISKGDAPALVLAEGVLPYLAQDDVAALLDDLRGQEAIQSVIVDYLSPELARARNAMPGGLGLSNVAFRFAPDDWHGFFASHGWKVKQMRDLFEEGKLRGRPYVVPEAMRQMVLGRQGVGSPKPQGTFAAYALMERA